ncbi:Symplekin tight junction protein C terminal-domain-containing protein [Fennellomyces sp. T-0311]|nr:Symplekin tight junction protein C terminal-domain-containing protein [Fennellomyces sp. T-0311]
MELDQLHEFDQEVLAHPESAQSYATNQFLDALTQLININAETEEEIKLVKDALRAFATVLPHVFKTVCQNEAETRMWQTASSLSDRVETELVKSQHASVQINSLKCIQVLILLYSKPNDPSKKEDFSLTSVRQQHRLLDIAQLEEKGQSLLLLLLDVLKDKEQTSPILSAVVNCLVPMIKKRTQFRRQIVEALVNCSKSPPETLSPVQKRSVEKIVKIGLTTLIRTEQLAQYRNEFISAFASVGGNPAIFQSRQSRERRENEESKRSKRHLAAEHGQEKRSKLSHKPSSSSSRNGPNPLANFDVTTLPLPIVIEICMAVLQSVPEDLIRERIDTLPPTGLMASSSNSNIKTELPTIPVIPPATPPPKRQERDKEPDRQVKRAKREPIVSDSKIMTTSKSRVPLASVQERASQSLKMQPYELAAPTSLEQSQQMELLKMSVQRIFDAEFHLQQKGIVDTSSATTTTRLPAWNQPTKTMWQLLVAKLLTRGTTYVIAQQQQPSNGDAGVKFNMASDEDSNPDRLKDMLVDFIVADLPLRHELALEWLHEEFHCDTMTKRRDPEHQPTYFKWLLLLLQKGIPTLEAKDKTLTKLMLDAPALNTEAIDILRRNMREEPQRFVSCVSTLRDLVAHRPPVREVCLNVLLDYCINPDVKMRSTSIVAVKKWVPDHQAIAPKVEAYAIQALQTLTMASLGEDKSENDEMETDKEAWKEQDVVRHAELFFALCAKKNDLLDELFNVYIHAAEQVQRLIRQHIFNLIKSIGMNSPKLLDVIRHFPPGGETLVIRILVALCDTVRPTPELVSAVKSVYQERNLDAKFLIPIVSGLGKEDLRQNLSKIVELLNNTEGQRKVVKKVFSRIVSSSATVAAPMTPTELLLALHEMEENVPLPKAVEAINICFTMPDAFEAKYVSAALRHLAEQPKIPILLMVTMIRTVSVYKNLVQFILQLLEKLIKKKVWTYPKLWDGFVKCTERTQPESVKMVANLPQAQLKDILLRIPSIQSPLREHAERNQLVKVLVLMNEMGLIEDEQ